MKKAMSVLVLVATIGVFGLQNAQAWRGGGCGGGMMGGDCARVETMDAATRAKFNDFMNATVEMRRDMFSLREQMRALQFAATPDQQAIDTLADQMFDLRTQIQAKATEVGWQDVGCGPGAGCGKGMGRGGWGRGGGAPCWNAPTSAPDAPADTQN